ncbi:MAG: response regulator [Anaerolineaceae bacterium]|nr:response regulator [Anaerolineaceae bacterium]
MDKKFRALIVEDDPSWQQILGEILVDMGLDVDYASNRLEAAERLRQQPHRLAILDLSLGGTDHKNQDGLAVADLVLRYDPACAIVFLTGFATVELAVKVMRDNNAVTCLRKEVFRRSEFRTLINQVLVQPPAGLPRDEQDHESWMGSAGAETIPEGEEVKPDSNLILVVEDDAGWRSLLSELLEDAGFRVIISSSYVEAIGLLRREKPIAAILDLSLASSLTQENMDGYRLLTGVKRAGVPAIIVSGYADPAKIEQAYNDGLIVACLEKQSFDRKSFRQALATAISGGESEDPLLKTLTEREREVLELIARGMTNKEIAQRLTITANTVKRHLKSLFTKLDVNTRSAASARAIRMNVLKE